MTLYTTKNLQRGMKRVIKVNSKQVNKYEQNIT